jgi:pyruvate formate lyase activating enzyme
VGIKTVAVTAGYIHPGARRDFYAKIDAANVDLKAFTDSFYQKLTASRLEPVLDTLRYLVHETDVWTEITTLLIPGKNDSDQEITEECAWIARELGTEVPLHFTAFHPDYRMTDLPRTPASTLRRARDIAIAAGIRHVYTGNVRDIDGGTTSCPECKAKLIVRDGYRILDYRISAEGACGACGANIRGRFEGAAGSFGARRMRVLIGA